MTGPKTTLFIALFSTLIPGTLWAGLTWEQTTQSFQPSVADTAVVAHFKFQNTGDAPVTFKGVTAACSCTQASAGKTSYAPGETGEITARFSLGDRAGAQTQEIYVETGDQAQPPTLLKMEVMIPKLADVEPDPLRWLPGEALQPKRVRVIFAPGIPARPMAAIPSAPGISVRLETEISPGVFEILVTPGEIHQPFLGSVRIETNFPPEHSKALLLHVQITP